MGNHRRCSRRWFVSLTLITFASLAPQQWSTMAAPKLGMSGVHIHKRADQNICDVCRKTIHGIPFYCPIKPVLPQCIQPTCPKFCDDSGGETKRSQGLVQPRKPFPPHPVRMPKVPDSQIPISAKKAHGRSFSSRRRPQSYRARGRAFEASDVFEPYDSETCEFHSPYLSRIKPDSKYIQYKPSNPNIRIKDIYEHAKKYGLVMAEMSTFMEWTSVEKSILDIMSSYNYTASDPRIYYAFGFNDEKTLGEFRYPTDNTLSTFTVMDPRHYGGTDARCGLLTHIVGSSSTNYMTSKLWNCNSNMEKGSVIYGLFTFPPGSICYRRSAEECLLLQRDNKGEELNDLTEMGQTLKRFIYMFDDQRSWSDSKVLCEAKKLKFLDLDPKWDDTTEVIKIIKRILPDIKINPSTMLWTGGRFDRKWSDGKFRWVTTGTYLDVNFPKEPRPYPFAWWQNQKNVTSDLARRTKIDKPCVGLALNSEDGGDRPVLNFMAWYCDFPMYPACYKEIAEDDPPDGPFSKPTMGKRRIPAKDSCEKPPEANKTEEIPIKFDKNTCTSKSPLVKRLTPNSKYVDYQPKIHTYSVQQIKEKCFEYGLVPGEIRTTEDWESVKKSGIGGMVMTDADAFVGAKGPDYFYAIGMDDSATAGKVRYNSDDSELTFSMFGPELDTDIIDRCAILDAAAAPDKKLGLMMLYENCQEGLRSKIKIAYGLCMFPRDWKCFKESKEEMAEVGDFDKYKTNMDLDVTDTRSLFFHPIQRNWKGAHEFCEASGLTLLDFDSSWKDTLQIVRIFTEKLVRLGGLHQLTPIWSSGVLEGPYSADTGKWMSTGSNLEFGKGKDFSWLRYKDPALSDIREGAITDACVEASFDDVKNEVRLRPDYCDMPKYFLCYRKSKKRRNDPPAKNTLGITMVSS